MAKVKTEAAQAAAMIRKELRRNGVAARVTCKNYSGGNSVDVYLTGDPMPATVAAVTSYANQFQRGHFDGMDDSYKYTNRRDDIPQVQFVFVNVNYSESIQCDALQWLLDNPDAEFERMLEDADIDARELPIDTVLEQVESRIGWRAMESIHLCLQGERQYYRNYWTDRKPRQRAA